jgi:hypothetical protein
VKFDVAKQQILFLLLFCDCCWIQDPGWIKAKIRVMRFKKIKIENCANFEFATDSLKYNIFNLILFPLSLPSLVNYSSFIQTGL